MKSFLIKLTIVLVLLVAAAAGLLWWFTKMPGPKKHFVEDRALSTQEIRTRKLLKRRVKWLASGPRNRRLAPKREKKVVAYIEEELKDSGWLSQRQAVQTPGGPYYNIVARKQGTEKPDELVVIGAHWDTDGNTPGADDNASGVAALLDIAEWLGKQKPKRSVELVFYANEEAPFFRTEHMGSLVHARNLEKQHANVVAMLSLEMLGYYNTAPDSQEYPAPLGMFYPDKASFIAFVGRVNERDLVTSTVREMRRSTDVPAYGFAGLAQFPGVGLSDHWSYWEQGYPAVMVTDTAFYRNPNYHQQTDTPETLDFKRFARVVVGLRPVISYLTGMK